MQMLLITRMRTTPYLCHLEHVLGSVSICDLALLLHRQGSEAWGGQDGVLNDIRTPLTGYKAWTIRAG